MVHLLIFICKGDNKLQLHNYKGEWPKISKIRTLFRKGRNIKPPSHFQTVYDLRTIGTALYFILTSIATKPGLVHFLTKTHSHIRTKRFYFIERYRASIYFCGHLSFAPAGRYKNVFMVLFGCSAAVFRSILVIHGKGPTEMCAQN